jgi:hypothetical protein
MPSEALTLSREWHVEQSLSEAGAPHIFTLALEIGLALVVCAQLGVRLTSSDS